MKPAIHIATLVVLALLLVVTYSPLTVLEQTTVGGIPLIVWIWLLGPLVLLISLAIWLTAFDEEGL